MHSGGWLNSRRKPTLICTRKSLKCSLNAGMSWLRLKSPVTKIFTWALQANTHIVTHQGNSMSYEHQSYTPGHYAADYGTTVTAVQTLSVSVNSQQTEGLCTSMPPKTVACYRFYYMYRAVQGCLFRLLLTYSCRWGKAVLSRLATYSCT